ncbi:MAG: AI-2E family transporter [Clostridium sp.]|nr:AI-2E family transporter [Prevotella sp.]MCM1378129.1 AI-2E family transporter [Prevotella sp.]MCM1428937.1 AI-2E family transporter [Clostridium sp.]MCM1475971.1 AI-2E family transporter [Muribaculaceae bacterium]
MSENLDRQPYTFDRVVRILFGICGILAVLYLLDILKGVLLPFMVACLLAYMMEPIVKWNMRWTHLKTRFIPMVLTLLEVILVIGIFLAIFLPYLVEEMSQMAEAVRKYATTQIQIPYISRQIHDFIRHNVNLEEFSRYFTKEQWMDLAKQTISSSWDFLSSSVAFILGVASWLIVLLYLVFIMLDYERLMLSFRQLVPHRHRRRVFRIFEDVKQAMNRYFRGQFIIAFTVGILFSIGFLIIDLPMGVVLGLFIGMLNMVPYLQLISLPITAVLCLVATVSTGISFWIIFWEAMAVYIVVQGIQDFILTPKIMGKAMGLNPAIILLSLSVWGSLLGFMGLIIALPLTTLLLSYYDLYVIQRIRRKVKRKTTS